MSSAVNPSVDALEFNSFRASESVSSDCWMAGVGDTSPSSRMLRTYPLQVFGGRRCCSLSSWTATDQGQRDERSVIVISYT